MFSLKKDKINHSKKIGEGGSASVYPYQEDSKDENWVVKKMVTTTPEKLIRYIQEIVLGFSFNHPHLLPVESFHINIDDNYRWHVSLILPRMSKSLKELILKPEPFSENNIIMYFYDLTCALNYLHMTGIVHCDIKPDNILFDKDGNIKVADPGIAKSVWDDLESILEKPAGTLSYWAPEISPNKKLLKQDLFKTDLWSLGVVMLEMCLSQLEIFKDCQGDNQKENKKEVKTEDILASKLQELEKKGYHPIFVELISKMLKINPKERVSLQEVKETLENNFNFQKKVACLDHKNFSKLYKEIPTNSGMNKRFEKPISEEFKNEEPISNKEEANSRKCFEIYVRWNSFEEFSGKMEEGIQNINRFRKKFQI